MYIACSRKCDGNEEKCVYKCCAAISIGLSNLRNENLENTSSAFLVSMFYAQSDEVHRPLVVGASECSTSKHDRTLLSTMDLSQAWK